MLCNFLNSRKTGSHIHCTETSIGSDETSRNVTSSGKTDISIDIDFKELSAETAFLKHITPIELAHIVKEFRTIEARSAIRRVSLFNCGCSQPSSNPGPLCCKNNYCFWLFIGPFLWPCSLGVFGTESGFQFQYPLTVLFVGGLFLLFQVAVVSVLINKCAFDTCDIASSSYLGLLISLLISLCIDLIVITIVRLAFTSIYHRKSSLVRAILGRYIQFIYIVKYF